MIYLGWEGFLNGLTYPSVRISLHSLAQGLHEFDGAPDDLVWWYNLPRSQW